MQRSMRGFDWMAGWYNQAVQLTFGQRIDRSQHRFLDELTACEHILVFGGGTGRILGALSQHCPKATIYYLDISANMIRQAQAEAESQNLQNTVVWHCGSTELLPQIPAVDAVIAPFVFDCFPDPELHMHLQRLSQHLKPKGLLLVSDFYVPKAPWFQRIKAQVIISGLYAGFNLICGLGLWQLPDLDAAFSNYPFQELKRWRGSLFQATLLQKEAN